MDKGTVTEGTPAPLTGKVTVESDKDFADYRVHSCQNYSIAFTRDYTLFTSDHGTLYVNPEGGTVVIPEENETELYRVAYKDYFVCFYPNQSALLRTDTGVFVAATEDHFMGYYSIGLNALLLNANRAVLLKNEKDLYFANVAGEVVHYDLEELVERVRFQQETWGLKNFQPANTKYLLDAKDIADGPGALFYSLTSFGRVSLSPQKARRDP